MPRALALVALLAPTLARLHAPLQQQQQPAVAAPGLARPSAVSAPAAFNDSFASFNPALWTQQTDIEHCSDGACFQARIDHLAYGPDGLTLLMNQSPCNTSSSACGLSSWLAGPGVHL